tara:strand:- start:1284 stop:2033 length:750 start_codon:yes stop_codon:yes gene_type:complete
MVEEVTIKSEETTAEKPVEQSQETPRPEGLPEKFKSVEDMAKSYSELESKLGAQDKTKENETSQPEPKQETKPEGDLEIAEKAVSDAGLNMETLQQEYNEKGQLDDKSYESLEKAGIPKSYVDAFINGQAALAKQQGAEVKAVVGGEESYNKIAAWAAENMTEGEKKAYNDTVNGRDVESIKLAVAGLKAKYDMANGNEPNLVQGKATPTNEGSYESWAQVTEAMADPRYAKDVAYQNAVKAKLANSDI